jgi:microcompartment protein CcmK/EutM
LVGLKLQLVQPLDILTGEASGRPLVAVDTVGAGIGDVVMIVGGSSARQTDMTASSPVDLAIVSIVDLVEVDGKKVYDRRELGGEGSQ